MIAEVPKITVLMTAYNGGRYLLPSVRSILNQTYRDFEFLIIDDCSTDGSLEEIRSIRDSRIRIHRNDRNLGQTRSLNAGLNLARGEFLARIDADDLAFPLWLEHQVRFLEENPACTVVSTMASVIDKDGRTVKMLHSPLSWQEILLKAVFASPINHVGSLMKTKVIKEIGGFDERFKIAADYDLWVRLMGKGCRLASTANIGVAIRSHDRSASVMEKGRSDIGELPLIMQHHIEHLTRQPFDIEKAKLIWHMIYEAGALSPEKFQEGLSIFRRIYEHVRKDIGIDTVDSLTFLNQQERIICIKAAFSFIACRNKQQLSRLLSDYIQRHGRVNLMGMMRLFLFLGMDIISLFPRVYDMGRNLAARFRLKAGS